MSLYKVLYNHELIIKQNEAIKLINKISNLKFSQINSEYLSLDIINIICNFYNDIIINKTNEYKLDLIKKYSIELGYNKNYLFHTKLIELHISTFEYSSFNELVIRRRWIL